MRVATVLLVIAFVAAVGRAAVKSHGAAAGGAAYRPVVLLHGLLGSTASMVDLKILLERDYPGLYVANVEIPYTGAWNPHVQSFVLDMNTQVEMFAQQISNNTRLADGFDLVCHSQGALTCRAYMERHGGSLVHNFISLAGPHAGVFGVPDFNALCPDVECPWVAEWFAKITESGGWLQDFAQHHLSFAQYWKDPMNLARYLNASTFLPDVNNERDHKNETYRQNLLQMTGVLSLVLAELDEIVIPKESAWFEFYSAGQDKSIYNLTSSAQYQGDWLGLKTLDKQGRLQRHAALCHHTNMSYFACQDTVYVPYVKPFCGTTFEG